MTFILRYDDSLRGNRIDTIQDAKREALARMIERSALKRVEILPIAPETFGGVGPPVLTAVRSRRGGPIRWQSS